jgi:hypothetical protein
MWTCLKNVAGRATGGSSPIQEAVRDAINANICRKYSDAPISGEGSNGSSMSRALAVVKRMVTSLESGPCKNDFAKR